MIQMTFRIERNGIRRRYRAGRLNTRTPRVGPSPAECKFELVLDDDGSQGIDGTDRDSRLELRKAAPHDGNETACDEDDC